VKPEVTAKQVAYFVTVDDHCLWHQRFEVGNQRMSNRGFARA
jgi:hypothetical protein